MQFYHHPLSLQSQQARMALEEKGLDYWDYSINPLKARNLDAEFFREHPNGRIPVLINGNRVTRGSLGIVQYIDKFDKALGGDKFDCEKSLQWQRKVDAWDPKLFTLSATPPKYLQYHSRFKRQVLIARMAENPDLANKYHAKLHDMHALEELLKDTDAIQANREHLVGLLEDAEAELAATNNYLAGESFSMADVMFSPLLARIELMKQEKEMIHTRPHLMVYWAKVKTRESYKVCIGKYSKGLGKINLLLSSVLNVVARTMLKRY
ncbi:hypothetical protein SELMODRAFT_446164 [Selaginella moellendorffii]|uniref:TCHQD class glutathione S-transferase n=1 Tax=Selaginella moellendorffii TaxID=88036 RepID=D8SP72_SELML|nr:glutathione S-transferase TCHQD [Selaginella moellendorffii]EFJ13730.1 hypothetical protein SELMODRAFT_446164 [Selaginella moellendorffii]|eukprot:XP_002985236.1 glutathione S-transferase TCHQD [Selaginella moellendorffii]